VFDNQSQNDEYGLQRSIGPHAQHRTELQCITAILV